ncbi:MAG TPA: ATP-binding protein [Candidatus Saccharimonadales bacterium]|nr:ATP-binding protein [Candidatus Saccharimonadales bacterium]
MDGLVFTLLLLYFIEVIGFFVIAGLVILRKRTSLYVGFFLFSLFVGIWQSMQFLSQVVSANHAAAVAFLQTSIVFAGPMAAFFLIFARLYTGQKPKYLLYVSIGTLTGLITLLSDNVQNVEIDYLGIGVPKLDLWYGLLIGFGAFCITSGVVKIILHLKHAKNQNDRRRDITLITVMASVGALVTFSSFYTSDFSASIIAQHLIPAAVLAAMFSFFYVIYRGLFDIHFFVIRALSYLITVFILTVFVITPIVLGLSYVANVKLTFGQVIILALGTVLLLYLLLLIRRVFDKVTKRVFFRDIYSSQDVIDSLSGALARTIDLDLIIQKSSNILTRALKPTFVRFILNNVHSGEDQELLNTIQEFSFPKTNCILFDDYSDSKLPRVIKENKVDAVVRLRSTSAVIGYIVLGHKESGQTYTTRDTRLLSTVSQELAIALQNALHFEEIQNFNLKLKQEVEDATAQLRETNKKLRKLDEIKDEFISMASHQLRTPLTSAKGYISMVLEGDVGRVTPQQRELLEQAFSSTQRMVYLIGDFLNVSRLQTGKFIIEWKLSNLADIVEQEVKQLRETAKRRDIELIYDKPQNFPEIYLDETKIHQVIMNFIDNAIFYTRPQGKVEVRLSALPEGYKLEVKDNGIGVPEAERHKLFSKFFRADNAKKARPDGTGIGLFMAKKVVNALGGSLIFDSKVGKGSTFGFLLPSSLKEKPSSIIQTDQN